MVFNLLSVHTNTHTHIYMHICIVKGFVVCFLISTPFYKTCLTDTNDTMKVRDLVSLVSKMRTFLRAHLITNSTTKNTMKACVLCEVCLGVYEYPIPCLLCHQVVILYYGTVKWNNNSNIKSYSTILTVLFTIISLHYMRYMRILIVLFSWYSFAFTAYCCCVNQWHLNMLTLN